jgi:hypothetical protein
VTQHLETTGITAPPVREQVDLVTSAALLSALR